MISQARDNPAVAALLLTNIALFVAAQVPGLGEFLSRHFVLYPPVTPLFELWQPLTHAFLHADTYHILFNMFGLWIFGRDVEARLGTQRFVILYLVAVLGAAFTHLHLTGLLGFPVGPMLGASGGVYGIVLAFSLLFPSRKIIILPIPVPLKAPYVALGMALIALYLGVTQPASRIAHFAHLGGMLFALPLVFLWQRKPGKRRWQ